MPAVLTVTVVLTTCAAAVERPMPVQIARQDELPAEAVTTGAEVAPDPTFVRNAPIAVPVRLIIRQLNPSAEMNLEVFGVETTLRKMPVIGSRAWSWAYGPGVTQYCPAGNT